MEKIIKIQELKIANESNKKIDVYLDLVNEELIFKTLYKAKYEKVTKWECIDESFVRFDTEETPNFQTTINTILKDMERKINLLNIVKAYFDNADLLEIKAD